MLDFKNLQATDSTGATQVELNSAKNKANTKQNVEIFSAMVFGKDLSKYDGKRVDVINKAMKDLAVRANGGDAKAQAEINAIRTIMIQTPLMNRVNLFGMMGEFFSVGKDEEIKFKVAQLQGQMSRTQANSSPAPYVSSAYRTETMTNYKTITGGIEIDYRQLATGNLNDEAIMIEQVQTDMMNQMMYHVVNDLYNGIKDATSLKNFAEATGIEQATLDTVLNRARRFGRPSLIGDFSVVSQLNPFSGFATNAVTGAFTDVRYSEKVMNEIMDSGIISTYKGFPVVEIENAYNMTKLNDAGTFFETYLPEGLLFVAPQGQNSPLKVGTRGGVETMVGQDLNTRKHLQRFDIEFGTHIVKEHIPAMGLISDDTYEVDKL